MLGHRLRRWPNITSTLDQRLLFAGSWSNGNVPSIIQFTKQIFRAEKICAVRERKADVFEKKWAEPLEYWNIWTMPVYFRDKRVVTF